MKRSLTLATLVLLSVPAQGADLLPQGIGLYQFGYRSFAAQDTAYNGKGDKVGLGDKFNQDLSGENLLKGKGGSDLQKLARELQKYKGSTDGASLVDTLNLGSIHGDVKADVSAQFFGLGFGLTRKITLFAGIPWVDATVRTTITHEGNNNAQTVKDELGGLAFAELVDGLDKASQINSAQIQESIESNGYAPIDEWSHKGFGDLKLGAKTSFSKRIARRTGFDLGLTSTLNAPTGYVEDPDVLTDISFGTGYYSLEFQATPQITYRRMLFGGLDMTYAKNLPTTRQKRVPEADEKLVDADRKTSVKMTPGDDMNNAVFVGAGRNWLQGTYSVGAKRHFSDRYSGSLEGNYDALADGSSTYQAYQEFGVTISSADAYQRHDFAVPFILALKAHQPLEARNSPDERYYEASISSFFSTPMTREEKPRRSH